MIVRAIFATLLFSTALPAQLQAQSSSGTLVVVNQKEHSVVLVDPVKRQAMASVSVGVNGHEVAVSKDGKTAYVPIYSNVGVGKEGTNGQFVDVIDIPKHEKVASIDLGKPVRPHKAFVAADGKLYVSAELSNAIDILDPKTQSIVGQLPTGATQSHMFILTSNGSRAYTANVGEGSVSVIDVPAHKLVKIIPLAKRVQRIALSTDEHWTFTSDQDQPRVAVIDNRTSALSRWLPTGGIGYTTQATPDGKYLLVSEVAGTKGQIEVFNLHTMQVEHTIPISARGDEFLIHNGVAYLSCPQAGRVEVLDLKTFALQEPIVLTPGVDGLAWSSQGN